MQTDQQMDKKTDKLTGLSKETPMDWTSFRYARISRFGEVKKIKKQVSISYKHLACVGTPLQTLEGADISHSGFIHKIYPNIFKMRPSPSILANLLRNYS